MSYTYHCAFLQKQMPAVIDLTGSPARNEESTDTDNLVRDNYNTRDVQGSSETQTSPTHVSHPSLMAHLRHPTHHNIEGPPPAHMLRTRYVIFYIAQFKLGFLHYC